MFLVFGLLARALVGRAREDIVLRATGAVWLYFISFLYCFSSSFRLIYYSVILVRVHYTPTPLSLILLSMVSHRFARRKRPNLFPISSELFSCSLRNIDYAV